MLGDVSASFPPGSLVAVVGMPGSGKSTLLKLLAGVYRPTFGEVVWTDPTSPPEEDQDETANPASTTTAPLRPTIAYLPQLPLHDSGREEQLTVSEQIETALRLRVTDLRKTDRQERLAALLEKTGLTALADSRGATLTADQQQRLALAVELTASPGLLLCDENHRAFDPKTELEFAKLLRSLAGEESRAVIHVTHALNTLAQYDSVIVLHGSQLVYHGPPEFLAHYFQIESTTDLYQQLAQRRAEEWHRSWSKHGQAYRSAEGQEQIVDEIGDEARQLFWEKLSQSHKPRTAPQPPTRVPDALSQFFTLLSRRLLQARRNPSALWLHLALVLGFPSAVVIFAAGSLTRLLELSEQLKGNVVEQLKENAVFAVNALHGTGLIAGVAMAQIILLAFLAAQSAAREIAGERMILEREKYSGLRPKAYVASKIAFLLPGVLLQSAWIGWFVHHVCRLPGNLAMQIAVLVLANAALTALALGISSLTRSAGRALLICFSIAALQLPFSGAVLAPPDALIWLVRPLVTLYWGTNAYLQSTQGTRFYEVLQVVSPFTLCPMWLCLLVLGAQVFLGITMTLSGCKIARLGITRKPPLP